MISSLIMSSVFRARPTQAIVMGLASLSLATALSAPGCTTNDCSDDRLGTVRCVQNRLEYCLATDEGNRLGYENCSSQGLFCSDKHKNCVTEEVLRGGDGGQGGTGNTGKGGGPGGSGGDTGPNGAGGMGAMSGPSGTGGMGGTGATSGPSGTGGMGGGADVINGCTKSSATVKTGQATVAISSAGFSYTPACVLVSADSVIEMTLNFGLHPTKPGTVVGDTA
ncbi:MAG: hypothetical protein VB934_17295, partial [Polyangiaceae bacterium]